MVCWAGMPVSQDRNSIIIVIIIEDSWILIKTVIRKRHQDRVYNILSSTYVPIVMW